MNLLGLCCESLFWQERHSWPNIPFDTFYKACQTWLNSLSIHYFRCILFLIDSIINWHKKSPLQRNSYCSCIVLHFHLCNEMERILPTERVEVPALFWWTGCIVSNIWDSPRLFDMETSWLWVAVTFFIIIELVKPNQSLTYTVA